MITGASFRVQRSTSFEKEEEQILIIIKTCTENAEQTDHDVAAALREPGTDYIDVLLLHYSRPEWPGRPPRLPGAMVDQRISG